MDRYNNNKRISLWVNIFGHIEAFEKYEKNHINCLSGTYKHWISKYTVYYMFKKEINPQYKYLMVKNIEEITATFFRRSKQKKLLCYKKNFFSVSLPSFYCLLLF